MLAGNDHRWASVRLPGAPLSNVPPVAGVYVITDVLEVAALRMRVEPIYVGRSRNLRRRLSSHLNPWRVHNASLSRRLNAGPRYSKFEFWFKILEPSEISESEKELIRALTPEANIIRYGEAK